MVLTALTGFVLLGGIKRIGAVAEKLVPAMCIGYIVVSLIVLIVYAGRNPDRLRLMFEHAFSPVAATGGFAGATIMLAMRYGVARGIFSNEAGLGTAGIAQAAGQSKSAAQSGLIGMMGTFIDTIVVCTMTGLVIMVTGVWNSGESGAALTLERLRHRAPGRRPLYARHRAGGLRLHHHPRLGLLRREVLGISWSGTAVEKPYRVLWTVVRDDRAITQLDFVWLVADTLNAFMAFPNLISLVLLSPVVVKVTNEYFASKMAEV